MLFASRVAVPSFSCRISSLGFCASFFVLGMWILADSVEREMSYGPVESFTNLDPTSKDLLTLRQLFFSARHLAPLRLSVRC